MLSTNPSFSHRSARIASNSPTAVNTQDDRHRRRRAIVREARVERTPLAPIVEHHPTENVLDACMLAQQHKRSQSLDARHYHLHALPNAIRVAARELTTADPAIVPLDGTEVCVRSLGEM